MAAVSTSIEYEVTAPNAMFADPATKTGGELNSYSIPTYSALVGITESIYWKPSIRWVIDTLRVMSPIRTEVRALLFPELHAPAGGDRAYGSYLREARYQVQAHFEFVPGVEATFNPQKHLAIVRRALERGGRRPIYLGKRDGCCLGEVYPAEFGSGAGFYDHDGKMSFGTMFHSIRYPTKEHQALQVLLWQPVMEAGIIRFIPPEQCQLVRKVKDRVPQETSYVHGQNLTSTEEEVVEC